MQGQAEFLPVLIWLVNGIAGPANRRDLAVSTHLNGGHREILQRKFGK